MQQSPTGKPSKIALLTEKYPYCPTYWIQYCKSLADAGAEDAEQAIQHAAAIVPDRMKLYSTLNGDKAEWIILMRELEAKRRQKEMERESNALGMDMIDDFLQLNKTPNVLPEIQYECEVDETMEREADEQDTLIDSFLAAEKKGELFVPEAIDGGQWAASDDVSLDKVKERAILTESLAKVYVRQGKYAQALAIFKELDARYSDSKSYFGDQIRFLERAIELTRETKQK